MCGVVGIISQKNPVAAELYDSLIHLQHRGQDAAGIITADTHFHTKKGIGLVRDIFDENNMSRLQGSIGLGHTRYPTVGGYDSENAQPVWTGVPYGIAMAHNGNLVNTAELYKELSEKDLRHLNATVDVEVILHVFGSALERENHSDRSFFDKICNSVEEVFRRISGAYSVIGVIIGKGMVVFRDPHGIRPLSKGMRANPDGTKDYIFSSETTMFYALGFKQFGYVRPGEVIYISPDGFIQSRILKKERFSPCIFEYVYFARPDTMVNDISVYRSRLHMGENLALRWKEKYPDIIPDIVIPAPSTANTAALSAAHALGVRYS